VGRGQYKGLGSDQEIGHASHNLTPLPYILHTTKHFTLLCVGVKLIPHHFSSPARAYMANCHQVFPGNTAFGRFLAASSPGPTASSTPAVVYSQACTAEQLALARTSLRLNPRDRVNFSQDTLSGLMPSETVTLTLLCQVV